MINTVLNEKDNICGNCFFQSEVLNNLCILTGDHKDEEDTCDNWLAERIGDYNEIN
jgi:hypothetical protein